MREEPCTDPYARFCGQTGAAAPSDPISIFFVAALLLFLAAQHVVPPNLPVVGHIVLLFALILIVMAPVILLSTFLLSALPGAREKLEKCEH